jgi:hypothetical protein
MPRASVRRWCFDHFRGGFGNNGSIHAHTASSIDGLAMRDRLAIGHVTVPRRAHKYKG